MSETRCYTPYPNIAVYYKQDYKHKTPIKDYQLRAICWRLTCSVVQRFPPEGTEDVQNFGTALK